MSNLSVIIIGAGKGTRMKSDLSKLLHKIGNLEMINHVINMAKRLNADEICVVCSEENIGEISKNIGENIKTVIQYERKGTAHATQVGFDALKNKNNDILVMYGDTPLVKLETYEKIIELLQSSNASIVDLGFNTSDIKNKYGRLIAKGDELEEIVEYKDASDEIRKSTLCNSGVIAIKSGLLGGLLKQVDNNNASKEYYLTDIIGISRRENKICKFIIGTEDEVMGVNSQEELSVAERIFQNNKRKEFMASGVTLVDPTSVYFSYDTEIENNVIIEPNVVFLPGVKISKHVIIHSFSYLEQCMLEEGVSVGPFARIRPQTTLKKNAHIGNFVEIKKSTIGEGTKIGHLTYIGDTTIGSGTNIGAGCITCNYDGFSKFHTEIGNNCFIGSNTVMVSPVKLKDGCLTAAGSIIIEDVGENDIAIARADQKILKEKAISYRQKRSKK